MNLAKDYIVDTNVLLDDPSALLKLRNGNENSIHIPYHVLLELNKFKKDPRLGHIVGRVFRNLAKLNGQYSILKTETVAKRFSDLVDNFILEEIRESGLEKPILVTNDKFLQLQAGMSGIKSEEYKESAPFQSEAEQYTGFVDNRESAFPNTFIWSGEGKPVFIGVNEEKVIDYRHHIWNITPRNVYQNLALELILNPDIDLVSIQSDAGYGKSFLALGAALYLTLEKKQYEKIYVVKPMVEIGQKLGYLPGSVEEKMAPYTRYISDLMLKLNSMRPAKRIIIDHESYPVQFNPRRFKLLPITYIRGMNIENSVVIIDEMQNMSRVEVRALLSRMGEGVKCICLGDIHQVDHPYLNIENNGLNWVVNKFKGNNIYAHIVLKGNRSRGPITDMVIQSGL